MCVSFQAAPVMKAARSNMLGAGMANNKVKYSRLAADDDGYIDLQVSPLVTVRTQTGVSVWLFLVLSND